MALSNNDLLNNQFANPAYAVPVGGSPTTTLPTSSSAVPLTSQQALLDQIMSGYGGLVTTENQAQAVSSAAQREQIQNPYNVTGFGLSGQLLGLQGQQSANDYTAQLQQLGITGQQQQLAYQQQVQGAQSQQTAQGSTESGGAKRQMDQMAQAYGLQQQQLASQKSQLQSDASNRAQQVSVEQQQNTLQSQLSSALFGFDMTDAQSQIKALAAAAGVSQTDLEQQLLASGLGSSFGILPANETPTTSTTYMPQIQAAAQSVGVPYQILAGVIGQGSDFNTMAASGGDYGLAQINLKNNPNITQEQAQDPSFAINYLSKSLGQAYKQFNGNVPATVLYAKNPAGAIYYAQTGKFQSQADSDYVSGVMKDVGSFGGSGTPAPQSSGGGGS